MVESFGFMGYSLGTRILFPPPWDGDEKGNGINGGVCCFTLCLIVDRIFRGL